MKGLKIVLLSCAIIYPFSSIIGTQIALADTPISSCINSLLYRNSDYGKKRTELSEETVTSVCKGVTTQQEASSIQNCVDSLLYRNSDYGRKRTETSEETAIGACAISRATPENNPIPASNTIIVVPGGNPTTPSTPGGSPKAITDCMKRLMYERKLVCTRSGFPRCSHFPNEGFGGWQTQDVRTDVSEQTAVQACRNAQ